MAFVVCEQIVVLSVCLYLILMGDYIYKNCYALEFMRRKFYDLLEKLELKIACWVDNSNVRK